MFGTSAQSIELPDSVVKVQPSWKFGAGPKSGMLGLNRV
jgi:hypothetical protein